MRASSTLVVVAVLAGCAGSKNDLQDPHSQFQTFSGYATVQQVRGHMEGTRPDPISGMPSPAGVPYTEHMVDVAMEGEFWPDEPTMLDTAVGMLFGVHVFYLTHANIDGMAQPDQFLPVGASLTTGTALGLVRRKGLLLALHSSLDLGYLLAERLGDTVESGLTIYGGVRGYYETSSVRTRLQYDFMPFWTGESRLEHRLTALVSTRPDEGWGVGVRAGVEVGQKRIAAGGLNDIAVTLGVEVQR